MNKYPKYIQLVNNTYKLNKFINGTTIYYGTYNTLKEAIIERDNLIKHNWDKKYSSYYTKKKNLRKRPSKHIQFTGKRYKIYKTINNKSYYFGTYDTLHEAEKMRDYFIQNGWNTNKVKYERRHGKHCKDMKYIRYKQGKYEVVRINKGDSMYVGRFKTLSEAKNERDFWESINWDINQLELY